ncbi:related to NADPH:quinone reductase and related Zn-dependent oxidoreductases [Phialocephala subalpina]|uniref:Related to NADPH:quinone reductase and related Zn-dependent oxidoreductases n=1 Tax=Phialocephala subalpina TaxID=576137 RepID=A0A1L7XTF3_9HELO|nr:related to NADPH:quinone reductase and related Zn-dependent oxidoreductases [Phialocephala subalpina]
MSRYITISRVDGKPGEVYYPLSLRTAPVPTPKPHEVLIKISAAALNHRDYFIRKHLYPGTTFGVPLLADGTGTVIGTGTSASKHWLHKRVVINPGGGWKESVEGPEEGRYRLLGGTKYNEKGTLCEYFTIDEGEVEEAPAHLSDVEAAALPVTGLTAWRALITKGGEENSRKGATILVTGIGGGVALMVLKFAVARGADVWVTSSSQEKLAKAVQLGARGGVSYREANWEEKLLDLLPNKERRFDAIIDGAGGDVVEKDVQILKHAAPLAIDIFVKEKQVSPVVSRVVDGMHDLDAIDGLFQEIQDGGQFGWMGLDALDALDAPMSKQMSE